MIRRAKVTSFRVVLALTLSVPLTFFNQPTRTRAVSESVVIYQVQTGGAASGTASQEYVELFNMSSADVNVTDWCIQYNSSSDSSGFKTCLLTPDAQTEIWLSAGGYATFATSEFKTANPSFMPDVTFSGGISGTAGHLRLRDAANNEVDKVGWGAAVSPETTAAAAHPAGKVLSRNLEAAQPDTDNNALDFSHTLIASTLTSGLYEVVVPIDACPNMDGLQDTVPDGYGKDEFGDCVLDVCPNLDDLQTSMPDGYELIGDACQLVPLESRVILLTELYPDAPSYDTGQEFIELYNPNAESLDLKGYQLQVGPSYSKVFVFDTLLIGPGAYMTLSDLETDIVLPNTSGVVLRLIAPAGNTVAESPTYQNAKDTLSWALVEATWIFTNQITPGAANKPYLQQAEEEELGITTVLAPCPAGKYRNPQTNRCRAFETAIAQLTPCEEDEYRNPETNRCRKVASVSNLVACEPGQERNPQTNRCRKISLASAQSASDLPQIIDTAATTQGTVQWPALGAVFGTTGGYMVYEWRRELGRLLRRVKVK